MTRPSSTVARLVFLALAPGALVGCASAGTLESPDPGPAFEEGEPTPTSEGSTDAERITAGVVEVALASIGTPYEWGGTDANGFDCSGLIQFAYRTFGIELPRVSSAQIQSGSWVELDPDLLRPGDILGFSLNDPDRTSHVGLYVGGHEFIHSSSRGVRISNILNPYWREHLVAARRIVR